MIQRPQPESRASEGGNEQLMQKEAAAALWSP